ncbi:MAG: MOSC and FAD-binding oxidoreductase domain-containing protein [Nocardioides sp.]
MARLVSVNVGMPQDISWRGRTVRTGVWKRPVDGPSMVRRLNIDGDGQGDLGGHGGEQRAVLVYQLESYRHWEEFWGLDRLDPGSFGENFTVDGLGDDEVCVGDRFRIGEAEFEVTQPRVTCFRVGMRMNQPQLPSLLVAHHRPGFYLRVITEGQVAPGDVIVRTARGRSRMTVAEIDALLYLPAPDRSRVALATDIPALSPGWRDSFRELLATAPGSGIRSPGGIPTGPPPAWPGFRTLVVSEAVRESATVDSYHLLSEDGEALPPATPGQFLTIRVVGAGDPPPVRAYSLSGSVDQGQYRISVKREPLGRVAPYLHDHLRPGDRLDAAAPRGDFVLEEGTGPALLMSAGIGVTPVLAMLHRLARDGSRREVWWIHTSHDSESYVFGNEVADLLASLPHARELVYFSSGDRSPPGVTSGRLTAAEVARLGVPSGASAYICGPLSFMDDMQTALVGVGVDARNIHVERFGSKAALNPGIAGGPARPHLPAGSAGAGPEVTFARSGLTTRWSDAYSSVLELAEACDIPTRWSCRSGVCHTCVTAVLEGDVVYPTPPLEPPGDGEALICSSRPSGELVLDL